MSFYLVFLTCFKGFREELGKFRAQLEHARKSDEVAQERVKGQEGFIQMLVTDPVKNRHPPLSELIQSFDPFLHQVLSVRLTRIP